MKPSVELQGPFSFMIVWVILAIVLILIVVFLQVYFRKKFGDRLLKQGKKEEKKKPRKTLPQIKRKYIRQLEKLEYQLKSGKLSIRQSYQAMSDIFRSFVYEASGMRVTSLSLKEIRKLNRRELTELVAEYYEPEFAMRTTADVMKSMSKTRRVMEQWH